jgi:hypothetical protein
MSDDGMQSLPSFARALRGGFPELENRAFAVSIVDFKESRPSKLPIALVMLGERGGITQGDNHRGGQIKKVDEFTVHYVSNVVKYKQADRVTDTPYYAYYDYEELERRMVNCAKRWKSPRGGSVGYLGVTIDAGEADVALNFKFSHHYDLCDWQTDENEDIDDVSFVFDAAHKLKFE